MKRNSTQHRISSFTLMPAFTLLSTFRGCTVRAWGTVDGRDAALSGSILPPHNIPLTRRNSLDSPVNAAPAVAAKLTMVMPLGSAANVAPAPLTGVMIRLALVLALVLPVTGCAGRGAGAPAGTENPAGASDTPQTSDPSANGAAAMPGAPATGHSAQPGPGTRLQPPAIPASLTDPGKRAEYLAEHYWQHYDFADTTLISNADYTEQAFVDFIFLLPNVSDAAARRAVGTLIGSAVAAQNPNAAAAPASATNPAMFDHFTELAEQYLYDPNSPMRNEELYIPFLETIIAGAGIDDVYKIRPRHQLAMALKNRPGAVAADFAYTTERPVSGSQRHAATSDGKATAGQARIRTTGRLSALRADYTLLFFYDPDCPDCKRVKRYVSDSQVFGTLITGQNGNTPATSGRRNGNGNSPVAPEGERPLSGGRNDESGSSSASAGGRNSGGKRLAVLAVYPDEDLDAWRSHLSEMPPVWTVGCDKAQALRGKELYDLKAIPTLYLLDRNKRVLLKDATVEQVEAWLAQNACSTLAGITPTETTAP